MSSKSAKPTIIIIHGAWQQGIGYSAFAEQIQNQGYPTEIAYLPSVGGTSTPLPGLAEDVTEVRKIITTHADTGKDIILLCHSYGGVVGSCAVEGYDFWERKKLGKVGGVVMVCYMAAFMVPKGKSLLDMLGGATLPWMKIEDDKCFAVAEMLPEVAFNDLPAEKAAPYCTQVTHTTASVFATPSTFEPWNNQIPCSYIFCSEDMALPYPVQQQMAAQLSDGSAIFTIKAGHCPFLSVVDRTVEVVCEVAEVGVVKKATSS